MKKKLLCLGLLLVMVFSFAACGKPAYVVPNSDEKDNVELDTEKGGVDEDLSNTGEEDRDSMPISSWRSDFSPNEALITSVEELNEFCKTDKRVSYLHDKYSDEYFKEKVLIVIIRGASSGSNEYKVKSVAAENNEVTVALQYKIPVMGTCDMRLWTFPIEYEKGDYSKLNVVVETKYQQMEVSGTGFWMGFTNKATLETINHIFSPEDFPELDFDFTIQEYFEKSRDEVKQALSEGTTDKAMQEYMQRYCRMFKINLTEKNKENVLRAVELLTQKKEVEYAEPVYEYYFEED